MHDDHVLIERRIERLLRGRLPAVHGADVPLPAEALADALRRRCTRTPA